ncbi:MAG TPA: GNAT family N-acetyltransferase, partial [Planctomycetota bacterium]|nr:GNAT family N-acetyltransferase [Planctomycetota bacterium]
SEIARGVLQSAYLGVYALAPHAGTGRTRTAVALALDQAFRRLRLHRVEANVQPDNARSLALFLGLGFREEGYSPRYLRLAGRWRDHVRLALLSEEWPGARRALATASGPRGRTGGSSGRSPRAR